MAQIEINTSQNVSLTFNVASIGERILAFFIDFLIKIAGMFVIFYSLFKIFNIETYIREWDNFSMYAVFILITLPFDFYTLAMESLMEGQTLGKKILKIKVVKVDGYQANFGDYLIRWTFRIIDVYISSGMVGLITMIINKHNLRLGDIASGTAVISLKNNINISHSILENISNNYVPSFPQVIALSDNDVRIIKENFIKAKNGQDRQIISRLANKILETLKLNRDDIPLTESKFIDTIIKDYNFYTGKDV